MDHNSSNILLDPKTKESSDLHSYIQKMTISRDDFSALCLRIIEWVMKAASTVLIPALELTLGKKDSLHLNPSSVVIPCNPTCCFENKKLKETESVLSSIVHLSLNSVSSKCSSAKAACRRGTSTHYHSLNRSPNDTLDEECKQSFTLHSSSTPQKEIREGKGLHSSAPLESLFGISEDIILSTVQQGISKSISDTILSSTHKEKNHPKLDSTKFSIELVKSIIKQTNSIMAKTLHSKASSQAFLDIETSCDANVPSLQEILQTVSEKVLDNILEQRPTTASYELDRRNLYKLAASAMQNIVLILKVVNNCTDGQSASDGTETDSAVCHSLSNFLFAVAKELQAIAIQSSSAHNLDIFDSPECSRGSSHDLFLKNIHKGNIVQAVEERLTNIFETFKNSSIFSGSLHQTDSQGCLGERSEAPENIPPISCFLSDERITKISTDVVDVVSSTILSTLETMDGKASLSGSQHQYFDLEPEPCDVKHVCHVIVTKVSEQISPVLSLTKISSSPLKSDLVDVHSAVTAATACQAFKMELDNECPQHSTIEESGSANPLARQLVTSLTQTFGDIIQGCSTILEPSAVTEFPELPSPVISRSVHIETSLAGQPCSKKESILFSHSSSADSQESQIAFAPETSNASMCFKITESDITESTSGIPDGELKEVRSSMELNAQSGSRVLWEEARSLASKLYHDVLDKLKRLPVFQELGEGKYVDVKSTSGSENAQSCAGSLTDQFNLYSYTKEIIQQVLDSLSSSLSKNSKFTTKTDLSDISLDSCKMLERVISSYDVSSNSITSPSTLGLGHGTQGSDTRLSGKRDSGPSTEQIQTEARKIVSEVLLKSIILLLTHSVGDASQQSTPDTSNNVSSAARDVLNIIMNGLKHVTHSTSSATESTILDGSLTETESAHVGSHQKPAFDKFQVTGRNIFDQVHNRIKMFFSSFPPIDTDKGSQDVSEQSQGKIEDFGTMSNQFSVNTCSKEIIHQVVSSLQLQVSQVDSLKGRRSNITLAACELVDSVISALDIASTCASPDSSQLDDQSFFKRELTTNDHLKDAIIRATASQMAKEAIIKAMVFVTTEFCKTEALHSETEFPATEEPVPSAPSTTLSPMSSPESVVALDIVNTIVKDLESLSEFIKMPITWESSNTNKLQEQLKSQNVINDANMLLSFSEEYIPLKAICIFHKVKSNVKKFFSLVSPFSINDDLDKSVEIDDAGTNSAQAFCKPTKSKSLQTEFKAKAHSLQKGHCQGDTSEIAAITQDAVSICAKEVVSQVLSAIKTALDTKEFSPSGLKVTKLSLAASQIVDSLLVGIQEVNYYDVQEIKSTDSSDEHFSITDENDVGVLSKQQNVLAADKEKLTDDSKVMTKAQFSTSRESFVKKADETYGKENQMLPSMPTRLFPGSYFEQLLSTESLCLYSANLIQKVQHIFEETSSEQMLKFPANRSYLEQTFITDVGKVGNPAVSPMDVFVGTFAKHLVRTLLQNCLGVSPTSSVQISQEQNHNLLTSFHTTFVKTEAAEFSNKILQQFTEILTNSVLDALSDACGTQIHFKGVLSAPNSNSRHATCDTSCETLEHHAENPIYREVNANKSLVSPNTENFEGIQCFHSIPAVQKKQITDKPHDKTKEKSRMMAFLPKMPKTTKIPKFKLKMFSKKVEPLKCDSQEMPSIGSFSHGFEANCSFCSSSQENTVVNPSQEEDASLVTSPVSEPRRHPILARAFTVFSHVLSNAFRVQDTSI
ncbi:uncharacterized protein LOC127450615 [Myxocyprinus asiaticus]|uniref:uncharacterized protein LOC127450615 n=1 Tax=Myxocyprinus asiaticus TaxID=70543 RepID=UPI002222949B|nr:uncharacterized protein LOC127450615 [Myxocyprinus asiaticus]